MEAVLVRGWQQCHEIPFQLSTCSVDLETFRRSGNPLQCGSRCNVAAMSLSSFASYISHKHVCQFKFFLYGYKLIRLLNFYVGCFFMRATPPIMTCLKLYPLRFPWRICNTWFILFIHLLILLVHTRCLICMKLYFRFDNNIITFLIFLVRYVAIAWASLQLWIQMSLNSINTHVSVESIECCCGSVSDNMIHKYHHGWVDDV